MIALLAFKKLVNWSSVTLVFCDVRSDSVRAISVTLRSTATPAANSLVPTSNAAISGMIMANSTAARPLLFLCRAATWRHRRNNQIDEGILVLIETLMSRYLRRE